MQFSDKQEKDLVELALRSAVGKVRGSLGRIKDPERKNETKELLDRLRELSDQLGKAPIGNQTNRPTIETHRLRSGIYYTEDGLWVVELVVPEGKSRALGSWQVLRRGSKGGKLVSQGHPTKADALAWIEAHTAQAA